MAIGWLGCGHAHEAAPLRPAVVGAGAPAAAFRVLSSPRGPDRFAQVTPSLYRGGQPTAAQLGLLRELGVRTIVVLADDPPVVRAETEAATHLGLTVHSHPFSGLSEPDPALLRRVVDELRVAGSPVYVHCRRGRDRTSLVMALYRVWVQGWDPAEAWRREALDFGHGGLRAIFFRKLDRTYARLTRR
ncbi:MAG: fused DSP-PTPase phosphatase/NAD kinase-like protein [Polyangia bacterium]